MPHHNLITEAPRTDLAGAKRQYDAGEALFVDVRDDESYRQSHIAGAVSVPLREIPRRYLELPRDRRLVFY